MIKYLTYNILLLTAGLLLTNLETSGQTNNIGIRTCTPGANIHVKGETNLSTNSTLNIENSVGTSMLFVRDDQRVGIGTISPDNTLDVNGSMSVTGDWYNQHIVGASGTTVQTVAYNAAATVINNSSVSVTINDGSGTNNSGVLIVANVSVSPGTITYITDAAGSGNQVTGPPFENSYGTSCFTVKLQKQVNGGGYNDVAKANAICGLQIPDYIADGVRNGNITNGVNSLSFTNTAAITYTDLSLTAGDACDYQLVFVPLGEQKNGGNYSILDRSISLIQIKR